MIPIGTPGAIESVFCRALAVRVMGAGLVLAVLVLAGVSGTAETADVQRGAQIAARRCASCHGPTGMGNGNALLNLNVKVSPVPWPDKARMQKFTDRDLLTIINLGGKAVGKSRLMPPFAHKLMEHQDVDLVAYIRSLAR